jgi:O-antigen ligase
VVTDDTPATVDLPDAETPRRSRRDDLEHVAMAGILVGWAVPLTRGIGGRDPHAQLVTLLIALPCLVALRPWRSDARVLLAAVAVSTAALLVCVLSPTGWSGADVAGGYVIAAASVVAVLRYARTPRRRDALAAAVCLAGIYQFLTGFVPWWRGGVASAEMTGTFFWHNPYAAFLMPAAAIGLGFVVKGEAPWRLVGWVSAPLCTAGIVLSSSRATLAVLVVAWIGILLSAVVDRATAVRAAALTGVSITVTFLLPGRPFFSHFTSPFAATTARSGGGETLASSGHYRTEFWREALTVGAHHPLVGGGFHALVSASVLYTPTTWARSQLAHNGYLQVWTDGGLLLTVPFLVLVAVCAWWALRLALPGVTRRASRAEPVQVATAIAILGAMAHSAVDFDWSHPTILVELAIMAAVIAPQQVRRRGQLLRYVAAASLVGLLVGMAVTVAALHQWQRDKPDVGESPPTMLSLSAAPFGDYRPAAALLSNAATGRSTPTQAQLRKALTLTARESHVDIQLQFLRLATQARLGDGPQAVAATRQLLHDVRGTGASYLPEVASVLAGAGVEAAARSDLMADLAQQRAADGSTSALLADLQLWARDLGTGAPYACQLRSARVALTGAQISTLPGPRATCAS